MALVGLSVGEYECTLGVLGWAGGEGWIAVECGGGKVDRVRRRFAMLLKAQMNYHLRLLLLTISTLLSSSPVSLYLFSIYISCFLHVLDRYSFLAVALLWSRCLLPWLGDDVV